MRRLTITIGAQTFDAVWEEAAAPSTCETVRRLLPLEGQLIHARWSGEAAWLPLGDLEVPRGAENAKAEPKAGELLLYPGGVSETEILVPYGLTRFACNAGPLAGNHFATITSDVSQLAEIGTALLRSGAQAFRIEER
ncbi:MAG TPA: DUF3830 family protein [Gemmatimonadaceae bacterium]|nr:DUF3830 family protein [Gemmatimonadaceae bacterium]